MNIPVTIIPLINRNAFFTFILLIVFLLEELLFPLIRASRQQAGRIFTQSKGLVLIPLDIPGL